MKDCLISLDIVFIVKDKVTKIHANCPPCRENKCKSYYGIANKVLELSSGEYNLSQGERIEFTD